MNKETRHAVKGGGDISSARDKLSNLPNLPGVYLFKDDQQSILYIGKSKSIRNRVRSYFSNSAKHNLRIQLMVSRIHDFSLIVTDTEAEALILEEQLIKRHHPRYNVALKDGNRILTANFLLEKCIRALCWCVKKLMQNQNIMDHILL